MPVPFIDLRRFEDGFLEAWAERSLAIGAQTRFVGSPEVAALERRLAAEAGVAEAVGCANGTDALQLALRALGVGPGDLVVLPDATFWATFEAVVNVGARPVTVDVDPEDLQLDLDLFREALDRHAPRAAIVTHLYGWSSARLDELRALCRARGLPLVEDGAQSWGSCWRGESIYAGAEVATVSFYPAKVLGACGDAGAVLCQDRDLAARVRQLGNHGRSAHYEHAVVGWNSRLGGLEAAWLDLSLDRLPDRLASRRRAAARYRERLADLPGLRAVAPPEGYQENGYLSVLLVEPSLRPGLHRALEEAGIGYGMVYPGAMSRQGGAEGWLEDAVGGEVAARLGDSVLNPPLFAHIRDEEVDEACDAIRAALERAPAADATGAGA